MLQGAIFDVDGTLLDSMYIWDNLAANYLLKLGITPKPNIQDVFKTLSLEEAAIYYQTEYGVPYSKEEIMTSINQDIETAYFEEACLKPHVPEFLEALKQNGVKLALATATDDYLVKAALERGGVLHYFDALYTCTMVGSGKSRPDVYRAACAAIGTPKDKTMVFEDVLYTVQTAKADGFLTCAVRDSHEKRQAQMQALADFYLDDYTKIQEFSAFCKTI